MSKQRKGRPRKPTGHIHGIPVTQATRQDSADLQRAVTTAPVLNPPVISTTAEQGQILNVDKVGFLGKPDWILTGEGQAYMLTVEGQYYRLPSDLNMWARDVVTSVLGMGGRASGIFPTRIEFGVLNDRTYAEMLNDD